MGKGDKRRPCQIPEDERLKKWDDIDWNSNAENENQKKTNLKLNEGKDNELV